MVTAQQKNHFDTFGFLVLRQAFSPQEMEAIDQALKMWLSRRCKSVVWGRTARRWVGSS